jgi:hypothetical protein
MPDDRTKSSSTATLVVVSLLTLAVLAGLCLCGGFGLFFVRVANSPPPAGAAGQGGPNAVPPNESMLKRFIDNLRGVPPARPVPPAPPPKVLPPEPAAQEAGTPEGGPAS